jgi:uncharacterized protein DUF6178
VPKTEHRAGRRRRRNDTEALRHTRDERPLLDRILDTPHLAHVVPQLPPELLHRVIQNCGLEDCGELVALATPEQLTRVFDLDLWRADHPGLDEQFDADRFGVWLEVLVESGAGVGARKLTEMDADLVTTALAQHVRVFDGATLRWSTLDGEEIDMTGDLDDALSCELGGYLVAARRTESWNAIVAALTSLEADDREYFHRVMRGCVSLSNSTPEIDGLDDLFTDREQAMFDLAFDRERRREQQGFVTPAQARAFLQMSRQRRAGDDVTTSGSPLARAYFRSIEWTAPADADKMPGLLPQAPDTEPSPEESADATASVIDALVEAGLVPQQPRALLESGESDESRLALLRTHMQAARDADHAAYTTRSQELAYLANTIVAGCSIQARPFKPQEASDAAAAICNLGLENWLRASEVGGTPLPEDFLVGHDLVSVFQTGWTVLYEQVCMYTAGRLIDILARMRCGDRETQRGLDTLRVQMSKHWRAGAPWHARDDLDVIATLDMPAWATLLGLIDECPVMHAALEARRRSRVRAVSPDGFEFISENRHIESVRRFVSALPETLRS